MLRCNRKLQAHKCLSLHVVWQRCSYGPHLPPVHHAPAALATLAPKPLLRSLALTCSGALLVAPVLAALANSYYNRLQPPGPAAAPGAPPAAS